MLKNKIKELRNKKGITLQQLADVLNSTKTQVQRLESGTRRLTLGWMERIAKALDCSPKDLIEDDTYNDGYPLINSDLLQHVMKIVEDVIIKEKISLSLDNKAKAVSLLYNYCAHKKEVSPDAINDQTSILLEALKEK